MTTQPEALPPLPEPAAHRAECDEWVQYHDPHDPLPEQWDDEKPDSIVPLFTADQMRAYATEHAARLHAECEALRKALERISGFTMSQFASINDMALECVNVANDALAARAAKEQA
jgi:hypothetical protein